MGVLKKTASKFLFYPIVDTHTIALLDFQVKKNQGGYYLKVYINVFV